MQIRRNGINTSQEALLLGDGVSNVELGIETSRRAANGIEKQAVVQNQLYGGGGLDAKVKIIAEMMSEIDAYVEKVAEKSKEIEDKKVFLGERDYALKALEVEFADVKRENAEIWAAIIAFAEVHSSEMDADVDSDWKRELIASRDRMNGDLNENIAKGNQLESHIQALRQELILEMAVIEFMECRLAQCYKKLEGKKQLFWLVWEDEKSIQRLQHEVAGEKEKVARVFAEGQEFKAAVRVQAEGKERELEGVWGLVNDAKVGVQESADQLKKAGERLALVEEELRKANIRCGKMRDDYLNLGFWANMTDYKNCVKIAGMESAIRLIGGVGLGYMAYSNPGLMSAGMGLFLRKIGVGMTVSGLNEVVMGYGHVLGALAAGVVGYGTSPKVGHWIAARLSKLCIALSAVIRKVPRIMVKAYQHRTAILALMCVGLIVNYAEMAAGLRLGLLVYQNVIWDLVFDGIDGICKAYLTS